VALAVQEFKMENVFPIKCDTGETAYNYSEYLQTAHWNNVKLELLNLKSENTKSSSKKVNGHINKDREKILIKGWRDTPIGDCALCGEKEYKMEVHHVTYKNLGHEDVKNDLALLCRCCHEHVHHYQKEHNIPLEDCLDELIEEKRDREAQHAKSCNTDKRKKNNRKQRKKKKEKPKGEKRADKKKKKKGISKPIGKPTKGLSDLDILNIAINGADKKFEFLRRLKF
tara:strand:- start:232 stop:912 length:681 start_codon:yes stop_codon:yes gene_type:complete